MRAEQDGGLDMSAIRVDPRHQPGFERGYRRIVLGTEPARIGRRDSPKPQPRQGAFLSVIVPAKNEAQSLPRLVDEIARALRPLCQASPTAPLGLAGFEILLVDDGSTDDTRACLSGLSARYPELRSVLLCESVGQSGAVAAGMRAARGDWIATLDADLQNDPADLVALWNALPGHDAALGWRTERHDDWSKRITSRWANRIRNWVLGQSIRDTGCSVRIFTRAAALRLPVFDGAHRFFGPLLMREGCRIAQVPVSHRSRTHGKSHYNLMNRSLKVIVDLAGVAWLMRRPLQYRVEMSMSRRPVMPVATPSMPSRRADRDQPLSPFRERLIGQEA
jgi:glycosyltransferase involved in cell wall biosynthesis